MTSRNLASCRKMVNSRQHPLGQVRVHADALPFHSAERARLVPDGVRDSEPPEVVEQPSSPQDDDV
jgi:hypothetical protein